MYTPSVAPPPHPFPEQEHVSRSRTPARFELAGVRVVVASRRLLLLGRLALAGQRAPQRARDARELHAHLLDLAHLEAKMAELRAKGVLQGYSTTLLDKDKTRLGRILDPFLRKYDHHGDLLRQDRLGRLDGLLVVRVGVGVGVRVRVRVRVKVRVRVRVRCRGGGWPAW